VTKQILIVDDEPAIRRALKRTLERAGHQVRVADNGSEGLEELQRQMADVVISDIIMAKVHGVEFISKVAKQFPAVRIIAISGGGNFGATEYQPNAITTSAYLAAAQKAGAHGTLTKPFSTGDVLKLIDAVMAAG
jgi:DNA-binding NtrC family response regulator